MSETLQAVPPASPVKGDKVHISGNPLVLESDIWRVDDVVFDPEGVGLGWFAKLSLDQGYRPNSVGDPVLSYGGETRWVKL